MFKYLRIAANVTQEDLARALGVAQPRISEWEGDSPIPDEHRRAAMRELRRALRREDRATYDLISGLRAADLESDWTEVAVRLSAA